MPGWWLRSIKYGCYQWRNTPMAKLFRLGLNGLECSGQAGQTTRTAVIGASAWALKTEQVEKTVGIIGIVGALLADLGYLVCPIGADAARSDPSLVVWVCGDETRADEYEQLAAVGAPGISIGSCVSGLEHWRNVEADQLVDRDRFAGLIAEAVGPVNDPLNSP